MAVDPYTKLANDAAALSTELGTLRSDVSLVIADLTAALGTLTPGSTITPAQVATLESAIAALNASVAPFAAAPTGPSGTGPAPTP